MSTIRGSAECRHVQRAHRSGHARCCVGTASGVAPVQACAADAVTGTRHAAFTVYRLAGLPTCIRFSSASPGTIEPSVRSPAWTAGRRAAGHRRPRRRPVSCSSSGVPPRTARHDPAVSPSMRHRARATAVGAAVEHLGLATRLRDGLQPDRRSRPGGGLGDGEHPPQPEQRRRSPGNDTDRSPARPARTSAASPTTATSRPGHRRQRHTDDAVRGSRRRQPLAADRRAERHAVSRTAAVLTRASACLGVGRRPTHDIGFDISPTNLGVASTEGRHGTEGLYTDRPVDRRATSLAGTIGTALLGDHRHHPRRRRACRRRRVAVRRRDAPTVWSTPASRAARSAPEVC